MCLTSCNASVATIPLPSKGPIQVNLNDPTNVAISVATLPTNTTPNVQEWNLQFEHQIGNNMTFSLAYVGDKGTHLITYYNYNRQQYGIAPCSDSHPPVVTSRPWELSTPRPPSAIRITTRCR